MGKKVFRTTGYGWDTDEGSCLIYFFHLSICSLSTSEHDEGFVCLLELSYGLVCVGAFLPVFGEVLLVEVSVPSEIVLL